MSNDPTSRRTEGERSDESDMPQPSHVPGIPKGEEESLKSSEPGRDRGRKNYQDARDSTGINAAKRQPIHPAMPNIPPSQFPRTATARGINRQHASRRSVGSEAVRLGAALI